MKLQKPTILIYGDNENVNAKIIHALAIVFVFGVIGNIVILAIVLSEKHGTINDSRRKFRHCIIYIASLSITLFCFMLTWVNHDMKRPQKTHSLRSAYWFAHVDWFVEDILLTIINYVLCYMAIDRMLATVEPVFYLNYMTVKTLNIVIACIFVGSVTMSIPLIFYYQVFRIFISPVTLRIEYLVGLSPKVWTSAQSKTVMSLLPKGPETAFYFSNDFFTNATTMNNQSSVHYITQYMVLANNNVANFSLVYDRWSGVINDLVPTLILITCNLVTLFGLCRRFRRQKNRILASGMVPNQQHSIIIINVGNSPTSMETAQDNTTESKIQSIRTKNRDLTLMTLVLSLTALVFSTPWTIYVFMKDKAWTDGLIDERPYLQFLVYVMLYGQYSIYPYIIISTTPHFRHKIAQTLHI